MTGTLNPDDVANAARRLTARLVADQAVDIIMSITGQSSPDLDLESPHVAVVVVARKEAMLKVIHWLTQERPKEITVVGGDDKLSPVALHRRSAADELVAAAEMVINRAMTPSMHCRLVDAIAAFKAAR